MTTRRAFVWMLLTLGAMTGSVRAVEPPASPPDLTQDRQVDRKLTYNLGATGLRGWIYTKPANFVDSCQGRTTTASRQILATHVGEKSPADGLLQVDDVILGAGGKPFSDDARQSIARAIQEAEREENGGVLKLTRWRSGKTEEVRLKLRVMGTYAPTAPYDCPKSRRIFDDACKMLEREPLAENWTGAIQCLALMATGKSEYLPRVQEFARKLAPRNLKLPLKDGMVTWEWGYRSVFLCEYYLLTQDQEVLPAIQEYTTALAKGQSLYGTFGHGIAPPTAEGKLHGSIPPYGPVNATGLVANLAIVLGKRCGVKHPEIDPAIQRAAGFFGYFVDKGAIPYGEHVPWPYHENNGKNAMAAVMFGLQADRVREAQYFAKMVTASFRNREYGHTGQGFSYLWGMLGANVGGPDAAAAMFREASWHLDLVRRCDGSFTYDGGEQYGPGRTDDDTYYGKSGYYGLSPTACYVLTYSLPLKKLLITGRDANSAMWLDKKGVKEAVASGRFDLDRQGKTADELAEALGDWSPVVRDWAAEELTKRPEAAKMVPALIAMAEGSDARKRQGACETLGRIKDPEAIPVLVRLLVHPDRWLRVKAAAALKSFGGQARPVVTAMLQAVVSTAESPLPVRWEDPIQFAQGELAATLFGGLLHGSLEGIDTRLLYPAIVAISRNPDGRARGALSHAIADQLSIDDVRALGPEILAAIEVPAPADTMFSNDIRMAGLRVLAKYHFREGLRVGVKYAGTQSPHGSEKRMGEIMKELLRYGTAAKEVLPDLEKLVVQCRNELDFPEWARKLKTAAVEAGIRDIQAATTQPALVSLAAEPPPAPSGAKPAMRTWKDATGKHSIDAQFVQKRGDDVVLRKKEGGLIAVPLARLSDEDRDWVRHSGKLPVKVFILAGQSNMEGQAVVDLEGKDYNQGKGTLKMLLDDPAKAPLMKHLAGPNGQWTVREDVWVWYKTEHAGRRAGPLTIGFSVYGDKHHFGPELQFGHVVGDYLEAQVLLIKTAWGGKSLYQDFRPPGSGGQLGPYYTKMLSEIREAMAGLKQAFPSYDGSGCELAGFVWYQGWNDGCTPNAVPEYEQNLVNLIKDLRKDLDAPRLPVVIGELTGPWVKADGSWAALREAQANAAARPEFRGTVLFVPTHEFVRKPEDSPNPGHGHHEFGNAETYFLVGDALGKGMTKLLGAASHGKK